MAKDNEPKYGVKNLAKDLGIDAAYVRTKLRANNVKTRKEGGYGWDSQAAYKEVVAKLKPKDKPAKKATAKKSAKKAAKKKPAKELATAE